jgi:mannose-1-phosphate guanylyltransferase
MGYLPDPIQEVLCDGSSYGVHISYIVEESPLGTAGAVKNVESLIQGPFVVFNGDVLTRIDLTDMIRRHMERRPKVSIALTPVDNPTIYGVIETDSQGMVTRFLEKPGWDEVTTNMINAGIYIIEPEVMANVLDSSPSMFEHDLFPLLLKMGEPILGYPSDAYWIDIGTPEKYQKVNQDLLLELGDNDLYRQGESKIHPEARLEGRILVGEGCTVAQRAHIQGPTVMGTQCKIGESAVIQGSILWAEVRVDESAMLKNCIVGARTHIQPHVMLEDCVTGDNVTIKAGSMVEKGARINPDTRLKTDREL